LFCVEGENARNFKFREKTWEKAFPHRKEKDEIKRKCGKWIANTEIFLYTVTRYFLLGTPGGKKKV